MKQYMKFLERFSPDKHFYTRTRCRRDDLEWEIYWNYKLNADGLWGIKRVDEREWQFMAVDQLCHAIRFRRLDPNPIEV